MDSPEHEPNTKAESSQGPSYAPFEHEDMFSSYPLVQVQSNCHSSGFLKSLSLIVLKITS
jgi:hypothetical protein